MKKNLLILLFTSLSAIAFSQTLIKDIYPGVNGSGTSNLTTLGSITLFVATDGTNGWELWKTDGTTLGTQMVMDVNTSGDGLAVFDGILYNQTTFSVMNGKAYFFADNGSSGVELWSTDGTSANTAMVKDINPGAGDAVYGMYTELITVGNTVYFRANDGTNGLELWKTDGTASGTVMVKNINPSAGSYPTYFFADGSTLYFSADDGTNGTELWKSDGTTLGTAMLTDINPGNLSSNPGTFIKMNGKIYFRAGTAATGLELWVTDGTAPGTQMVKDMNPGSNGSNLYYPVVLNNHLYFNAYDDANGNELWVSDGTGAGTYLLKNIQSGLNGSNPAFLTVLNGRIYFSANESTHGTELWSTDGTTLGTSLFLDINNVSNQSSNPQYFIVANGSLYFNGNDGTNGAELWKTDGTVGGTTMLNQMCPGSCDGYPYNLIQNGNTLYFSGFETNTGTELYKLDLPATGIEDVVPEVVSVYPNPNQVGSWNVECGSNFIGSNMEVFDTNGKLVFQSEVRNQKSAIAFPAARGVYLLRITSGSSSAVRKLVRL